MFYLLLEKNEIFLNKIFNDLVEYTNKKPFINNYLNHIGEHVIHINYANFTIIKNKKKHIIAILSCAIIWSFNETTQYKETESSYFLPHDSYLIINEIIKFLDMFKQWCAAYHKQIILNFISDRDHKTNIYRIITIIIHTKTIKTEKNYIKWLKQNKIYYYSDYFKNIKIFKIYTKPFEYKVIKNKYLLMGEHYSNCWQIFIENINSGSTFNLLDTNVIKNMTKMNTYIDFEHYNILVNLFFKENKLKKENIKEIYQKTLKEYKLCLKQSNKNLIKIYSKKLSKYQKALNLLEISNMQFNKEEKYYLPWNYDFRGRTYYLSDISFTFNKEFRWCMYSGYYTKKEDFETQWHSNNILITNILNKNLKLLKNLKNNIKIDNIYINHIILWILISIGETNKKKLGKEITIDSFINEGIEIFNTFDESTTNFDYEEKIKIITLIKIINEVSEINEKQIFKIKKRLISKDAPASVFQHLVINFGGKNTEIYKKVNLYSKNTYYDIYEMLIKEWKDGIENNLNDKEKKMLSYFTRKSIKKVAMTANYGVSYNSAEDYFINEFIEIIIKNEENYESYLEKNWEIIQNLFKNFYIFITQTSILKLDPNTVINYIEKKTGTLRLKDAIIDLNYYENDKYVVDILNEGKRYTKSFNAISTKKDNKKFEISTRANFIHSLDSAVTRFMIKKCSIFSIHDCFLIDYANTTFLVSLLNEAMAKKYHKIKYLNKEKEIEIFSIFIVI